jgi:hypothetical protein
MIKLAALAILLAAPGAARAQDCMSRQEVADVFVFSAPVLIEAAANKCKAALPPGAFLSTRATALASRLRGEGQGSGAAIARFIRGVGGKDLPEGISPETLQSLTRDILGTMITNDIKPADCGKVDALIEAIAPLPARNIGMMIASLIDLTTKPGEESPFKTCPDPVRR